MLLSDASGTRQDNTIHHAADGRERFALHMSTASAPGAPSGDPVLGDVHKSATLPYRFARNVAVHSAVASTVSVVVSAEVQ